MAIPFLNSETYTHSRLGKAIASEFPKSFGNYHEPFLSCGTVFFHLVAAKRVFQKAFLSSPDPNVIRCYSAVQDNPEHVAKMLEHCLARHSQQFYDAMKSVLDNPSVFIYINRANKDGRWFKMYRKETDSILSCSAYMMRHVRSLYHGSWEKALSPNIAKEGDLVYLSPPTIKANALGGINYVKGGFNESDYLWLKNYSKLLKERGLHVFFSNSNNVASVRILGKPSVEFDERTALWRI